MQKYRLYILMAFVFAGLAVQAILASPAHAAVYISQGTVTSTNLLSGASASSFNNFYYNLSLATSTLGNSSVTIQFSADNITWYSASGTPAASTTLSTTGGANLSLTSLNSLGWSGTAFYYKMYLYSTGDLTGTPVIKNIRLDYTPTGGYENGFVFNNDGSLTFTGANPQISATSTNSLLLQSAATGNIQFFNSSNQITSAGNLTVAGGITGTSITATAATSTLGATTVTQLIASTINGNTIQSGSGTFNLGSYSFLLTGNSTINQNLTTTSTPTFANLNLTNALTPINGGTGLTNVPYGYLVMGSSSTSTLVTIATGSTGSILQMVNNIPSFGKPHQLSLAALRGSLPATLFPPPALSEHYPTMT